MMVMVRAEQHRTSMGSPLRVAAVVLAAAAALCLMPAPAPMLVEAVNATACTLATPSTCASLNRAPCTSDESDVCGPCLRLYYADAIADTSVEANTPCHLSPAQVVAEDGVIRLESPYEIQFQIGDNAVNTSDLIERHFTFDSILSALRSELQQEREELSMEFSLAIDSAATSANAKIGSLEMELDMLRTSKADSSTVMLLSSELDSAEDSIGGIHAELSSQSMEDAQLSSEISTVDGDLEGLGDSVGDLADAVAYAADVDDLAEHIGMEISTLKSAQAVTNAHLDNLIYTVEAQSKGLCNGDQRLAWFNGEPYEWQTSWARGINMIILDPDTLHPVEDMNFDTCCREDTAEQVADLIAFLRDVEVGTTIVFIIQDEGVYSLTDEAKAELENFGSKYIRTIVYRESWVMIGVKGAEPGTVPEDHGGTVSSGECGGTNRPTRVVKQTYFAGKLNPFNSELTQRILLEGQGAANGLQRQGSWDGFVRGPGNYPQCTDRYGVVEIGKIRSGHYLRYIDIKVYGSHRGYHPSSYYDYKHFIVMCGDKCTSHTLESRGRNLAQLWDTIHGGAGDYGGNGDIDIPSDGYTIAVYIPSVCGANFDHTIVVEYYSFDEFHSALEITDHRCYNMVHNGGTPYPFISSYKCWSV